MNSSHICCRLNPHVTNTAPCWSRRQCYTVRCQNQNISLFSLSLRSQNKIAIIATQGQNTVYEVFRNCLPCR